MGIDADQARHCYSSCFPIDYENAGSVTLQFRACGQKLSSDCPSHLDGTANAFVLQPFQACSDITGEIITCGDNRSFQGASVNGPDYVTLGQKVSAGCTYHTQHGSISHSEWIGMRLRPNESIPTCAAFFSSDLKIDFFPYAKAPEVDGQRVSSDNLIIVRRFHNSSCPSQAGETYNAVVVKRMNIPWSFRGKVFACLVHNFELRPMKFHDDRCGVDNGINAVYLDFSFKS